MTAGGRVTMHGRRRPFALRDPGLSPAAVSELRGRFVDISPRDRERLVRLVFARQRVELAERRRSQPR